MKAETDEEFLKRIESSGLVILQFDGKGLRQRRIGYNKSLLEFMKLE